MSAAREVCLMCAGTGMEWLTLPQSLLCLPPLHSFYLTSVFFLEPVYSNYGTLTSTLCLTGSLLEMQHLRPHADLLNRDLRIYKVQILWRDQSACVNVREVSLSTYALKSVSRESALLINECWNNWVIIASFWCMYCLAVWLLNDSNIWSYSFLCITHFSV